MKLFIVLPFLLILTCRREQVYSHPYRAIFSFGDSYSDTGNLVVILKNLSSPLPVFIDKFPYGETFFHHPTGRCSDGRLIVDFLAKEFDIPYLKPYLAHNGSFRQGANFAVAGATTLDLTFFRKQNITMLSQFDSSLNFQLKWFEELKPSLCNTINECTDYFGKSLFIVGEIGINDYNYLMFNGASPAQARVYAPKIIKTISMVVKRLIDQGARTLVVPGIVPMGCLPTILTLFKGHKRANYDPITGCLEDYNMIARYHNSLLLEAIKKIRIQYPHTKIVYADYYEPLSNFVRYPKLFGLNDTPLRACCGVGGHYNWNINETCGMSHVKVCGNPSNYANWDGIHLTEATYLKIAYSWLYGLYADPPILGAHTG